MASAAPNSMKYRFLGNSGLLVSQLSYGCMLLTDKVDEDTAYDIFKTAYKGGINFFDNAEVYGGGSAETTVGKIVHRGIKEGEWIREDLVLATKIYMGTKEGPNARGLSRKHLVEGIKASLTRMQLDYVDVLFCHRPDPHTPMEEVVRAVNFIINQGWAFYWGTSEWSATEIDEACGIADRLGLIRPVAEQPQYNILQRARVEIDFMNLYTKYKLGLTTWSPLSYGILTGKYANGVPEDSRLGGYTKISHMVSIYLDSHPTYIESRDHVISLTNDLKAVADEVGCTLPQFALAWCMSNKNVSTTMMGGSSTKQIEENLKALAFVDKITPEIKAKVDKIIGYVPKLAKRANLTDIKDQYL